MGYQRSAYVFFATGDWSYRDRRLSWRRQARIARRFPRRYYHWWLTRLVHWATGSRLAHVAIGDGEVVLEPSIGGDRAWPHIAFVLSYTTLAGYFTVPISRPLALDMDTNPRPVWPSLLKWWTRGRWRTSDCVCTTIGELRRAGVDVPPRVWNPAQLFDWLHQQGYEYEHLSGWRTRPVRGVDRAAEPGSAAGRRGQRH